MSLKNEGQFQKSVYDSLMNCFPDICYIVNRHPDMFEGSGYPDLVGHIMGVYTGIELKVDGGYVSPEQKGHLRSINRTGGLGIVMVFHRKDQKVYIVPPSMIDGFSYKDRDKNWVTLPWAPIPKRHKRSPIGININLGQLVPFLESVYNASRLQRPPVD